MDTKEREARNESLRKRMCDVREIRIGECPTDSPWVRPFRIHYVQDGKRRDWDVVRAHDGVSIIAYNTSRKRLVFVRQFRPASYYTFLPEKHGPVDIERYPTSAGITLELCAGIIDKDKPLVEIAQDELREECGYEAPADKFTKVITFRYVSTSVSRQTLFYVEVTDEMRTQPGGGVESEGEIIEVVELSIPEVKDYVSSEEVQSPPDLLYGVSWFLANKPQHCS